MKSPIDLQIYEEQDPKPQALLTRLNALIRRLDLCYRYLRGDVALLLGTPPNNSKFEDDGTLVFQGEGTVWDDLRVPASATKLNASKTEPAMEIFIGGILLPKFDISNADDESLHFVAQMPHGYKEGSDIYPHLHWSPDSTNTGNAYWSFEYTIANINGTFGTPTTVELVDAADGTALKHQIVSFPTIDGTGLKISHMILCRLTRKSSSEASDTFTGNAAFIEFDFHYEKDMVGSRKATSK